MYKLIEFLRRIYVAVLFVVFEAIAIGYYAHSSNYTQAKLLTRSNQVVGGVNGIFADIRSYFTLGRENERLLERVAVLEEELAFYRRSAADSVRTDLLHDMGEKPYELTVARVISNSINKNRNFIVLDRGERDGVEKGMGVLSPEGAWPPVPTVMRWRCRFSIRRSMPAASSPATTISARSTGRVTIATTSA